MLLGIPTLAISDNFLPALKLRAQTKKIAVTIIQFDDLMSEVMDQVSNRWKHGFDILASSIKITLPNDEKTLAQADKLVESLKGFFSRHQYTTATKVRKTQNKVSIVLSRTYDSSKSPELKG